MILAVVGDVWLIKEFTEHLKRLQEKDAIEHLQQLLSPMQIDKVTGEMLFPRALILLSKNFLCFIALTKPVCP